MTTTASERRRGLWAAGALGLIVLIATALVARQGIRIHGMVFYDEKYSVEGARFLDANLGDIFSVHGYAGRGLERLTALLFLPVVWLFPSTADQFVAGHWVWAACWALLALPVFAIARGLELSRRWALAAAAMAVFVPWAVFGTIFINTAPATTTAVAALWAMWRSVVRPSLRTDALAVALIALATLARVSHAGLAVAWPIAILVQAWRDAPPELPRGARLRALPRQAVSEHRLLVWAALLAVAALVAKGFDLVVGGYPATIDFPISALWRRLQLMVAHAATGMAFVAFIVGLSWLLRTLVAPRDRLTGSFAVLTTAAFSALLYVNHVGGYDERYEMPAVALLFVAFAVALARREVGVAWPAAVGVATWICVSRFGFIGHHESFDYINAPGRQWFSTGWVKTLSDGLGARHGLVVLLVVLAATAVAVALGMVTRGRPARILAGVVVALTLWSGFGGARFLMLKLPAGYRPGASFADMTFVDRATGGERADPVIGAPLRSQMTRNGWLELQFFNRSIHHPLSIAGRSYALCCLRFGDAQRVRIDPRTGVVTSVDGALPRYVLTTADWTPGGLAARVLTASAAPIRPVRVERLASPARAAWRGFGFSPAGWLAPGGTGTLRVYSATAPRGPVCLRATFLPPDDAAAPAGWRLGRLSGRVAPRHRRRVEVRVSATRAAPYVDVRVRAAGARVGLRSVAVVTCGTPDPVAHKHPA